MGLQNTDTKEMTSEDFYLPKSKICFGVICAVRILSFIGWIGGMIYATWQIFLAAEKYLVFQRNPIMNPGYFTDFLNRGRDSSDEEWDNFSLLIFRKMIYWYAAYLALSQSSFFSFSRFSHALSPLVSLMFLGSTLGWLPTAFLFIQAFVYWLLMKIRSKLLIWTYTMTMVVFPGFYLYAKMLNDDETAIHYLTVTAGWNYCRCVSFVFEYWDRPRKETDSLECLLTGICYCFYFPPLVTGPLILFGHYQKHVMPHSLYQSFPIHHRRMVYKTKWRMLGNLLRILLIALLMEFLMHYFYVRSIVMSDSVLEKINLWVVCGSVYWIGQLFTLKYQVMYGIPSFAAEVDGVPMPPLPVCPGYIHRYSVLWKDFDRGLYYFLVRYIYVPVVKLVTSLDSKKKINTELIKLFASFITFLFIYVWHGTSFYIFVWASFNFLGITIERIGGCIKKEVDKRWKVNQITWDFIIEPIATIPLAFMQFLNSSIFCESLESAVGLGKRFWNEMGECYAFVFIYFFTHVSVTIRTWPQFVDSWKKRQKVEKVQ